ncbi:hypothetical protein Csa_007105 [Cucumis sativus]|nr:hypothetical protein Csa_007105 [Cucumis sativus]
MHLAPRLSCIHHLSNVRISSLQLLQIHAQLITNGFKSPSPYAKLITHLCKKSSSESIAHAHLIFRHHQYSPNLFLFNTLIRCAPPHHSISIFATWVSTSHFEFDDFTFIFVLGACARAPSVSTLMIGGKVSQKYARDALELFRGMLVESTNFEVKPTDTTMGGESFDDEWCVGSEDFVALSNVYASVERWDDVEALRDEMKIKGIENKAGCSSLQTTGSQGLVEALL